MGKKFSSNKGLKRHKSLVESTSSYRSASGSGQLSPPVNLLSQGESGKGSDFKYGRNIEAKSQKMKDWLGTPEYRTSIREGTAYMIKGHYHHFLKLTDTKLGNKLLRFLHLGSFGKGDKVASAMKEHLMKNTGADFVHTKYLSDLMYEQDHVKTMLKKIELDFRSQMKLYKGEFTKIRLSKVSKPSFSATQSPTLLTLVGGTQELQVNLTHIEFAKPTDSFNSNMPKYFQLEAYKARLEVTLFDDFGVSEGDVTKGGMAVALARDGLMALWILMKRRNYKPFRTRFRFTFKVSGTI